jgi:hypothetical protein
MRGYARIEDKKEAIRLRKKGMSIRGISKTLKISKGSIGPWVKGVVLSKEQIAVLMENQKKEREDWGKLQENLNRTKRIIRDTECIKEADSEWPKLQDKHDFILGLGLYAGEGRKTGRWWSLANMDYRIIQAMMRFLVLVGISTVDVVLNVNVVPDANKKMVERYWRKKTGVSDIRVKEYRDSRRGSNKLSRGTYRPNGICDINVKKSTKLFVKTKRWMETLLGE